MSGVVSPAETYGVYACPTCKRELQLRDEGLYCHACAMNYPIVDGIPDFIVEDFAESSNSSLRSIGKWDSSAVFNFMGRIYETWIYPPVCNLFGGWRSTSLKELARDISDIVGSVDGLILDAACGPGTYGRRVASASRVVYGIDASMSFALRPGIRYVERDHIPNVHFARAKVEALPFPEGTFDAAICAGALNHFSDTVLALREIGRTMKAGAPLAGMCFAAGTEGLFKYRRIRERLRARAEVSGAGRIFELPELEGYLAEAGFEEFHPHSYGSILVFSTRKKIP